MIADAIAQPDVKTTLPEPLITDLAGIELIGPAVGLKEYMGTGQYYYVNPDITPYRFPLTLPAGPRNLFLAQFGIRVQSKQVEAWATEHGYQVALIDDLLAVGSHAQYGQLLFPIVALGSFTTVWIKRRVPCLRRNGYQRWLSLLWYNEVWSGNCSFLLSSQVS